MIPRSTQRGAGGLGGLYECAEGVIRFECPDQAPPADDPLEVCIGIDPAGATVTHTFSTGRDAGSPHLTVVGGIPLDVSQMLGWVLDDQLLARNPSSELAVWAVDTEASTDLVSGSHVQRLVGPVADTATVYDLIHDVSDEVRRRFSVLAAASDHPQDLQSAKAAPDGGGNVIGWPYLFIVVADSHLHCRLDPLLRPLLRRCRAVGIFAVFTLRSPRPGRARRSFDAQQRRHAAPHPAAGSTTRPKPVIAAKRPS